MLLVDKPAGVTSHDVVAMVRRAVGERRIGHAGTLDPFATGLLVLLVGRSTRLVPYLDGEPKVYEAEIVFGSATDTDDRTGTIVGIAPPPPAEAIAPAMERLTGTFEQLPPAYSAKKIAGRRSYEAARHGEALVLRPVPVTVHRWELLARSADRLTARITCGGGTYVRALARDLGRETGSVAHLGALRRVRSGPFDVAEAQPLDLLEAGERPRVLPPRAAIPSLPVQQLHPEEARRIGHGLRVPATVDAPRVALLAPNGVLLAIADREDAEWQPRLVLS